MAGSRSGEPFLSIRLRSFCGVLISFYNKHSSFIKNQLKFLLLQFMALRLRDREELGWACAKYSKGALGSFVAQRRNCQTLSSRPFKLSAVIFSGIKSLFPPVLVHSWSAYATGATPKLYLFNEFKIIETCSLKLRKSSDN
jgi:hypothetical protein